MRLNSNDFTAIKLKFGDFTVVTFNEQNGAPLEAEVNFFLLTMAMKEVKTLPLVRGKIVLF